MLGLSRDGRDTVLSNLKRVRMRSPSFSAGSAGVHSEPRAMGRLLHRACCQAPAGLEVNINLAGSPPGNADYIS
jgi:hypothetical protein